jgi:hypothetical protein
MENILYSVYIVYTNKQTYFFGTFTSELFALDALREHISSQISWAKEFWSKRPSSMREGYVSDLELKFAQTQHSFSDYEQLMNCDVYAVCAVPNYGRTKIKVVQCRLNEVLPDPQEKYE